MRSLFLEEQFYTEHSVKGDSEQQLVFTFSDKIKEPTHVWYRLNDKLPEIFVQGVALYKSNSLVIRDESYRVHKGFYEINAGHERWVDLMGNEIHEVLEWMKSTIEHNRITIATTALRS